MTVHATAGWEAVDAGAIQPSMDHIGYHAVMLAGYDDRRAALLVKNSWGDDWGMAGYAWLPYLDFERNVTNVWLPAISNGGLWSQFIGLFR